MSKEESPKKKVTLDEIAERAGTTKSTVSRVLSNHPRISESTRQRVMDVVRESDYQPNLLAQGLARGRTGLIGVLSSNIGSGFYADVLRGIDMVFTRERHHMLCSFAHTVDDFEVMLREMTMGGQIEGLIVLAPYLGVFEREYVDTIPLALCAARPVEKAKGWSDVDSVTLNNSKAMVDVIEHLVGEGHRTLVHLAGPQDNYDALARRQSFEREVKKHSGVSAEVISVGFIREEGQRVAEQYLADHDFMADAFVAVNDSVAYGFLEVLRERYPRNAWPAGITGWDNDPLSEAISLTSVAMPAEELGIASARMLLDRLDEAQTTGASIHRVVDMELQLRRSSMGGSR